MVLLYFDLMCSNLQKRIRGELQAATRGRDRDRLEKAIDKFTKNRMWDNDDLTQANNRLQFLTLKRG